MNTRALMIAAPRSGGGKTTTTLGLLTALRKKGLQVQAAKTGPDYIDPAFHEVATGRPSLNLDSWTMSGEMLETMLADAAQGADILLIESAMGLFDGLMGPQDARGAPSDIAQRFGIPVLLVLDVSGQGQSAAATAHGFATLNPNVNVVGVVLNQVGSERHLTMASEAIRSAGLKVLGAFMRDPTLQLPERHLGLVQAREQSELNALLSTLGTRAEASLDIDAIIAGAQEIIPVRHDVQTIPPPGQRIAVADDQAFSFFYSHLARSWRLAGAVIVPFSPMADEAPDPSCDACWLPGGYPELHGPQLASASYFHDGLRRFAQSHPVHGECGGFMVLGRAIEDAQGVVHPMTGLLDHVTTFARRKMNLGYREATLMNDCALGTKGDILRGHEFHYARISEAGSDEPLAMLRDGNGKDLGPAGAWRGHVSGSFFHVMAARHEGSFNEQ